MLTVENNVVVTLSYVVQENDKNGVILETMDVNYPFVFLFGSGALLPAFESNIKGLEEGQAFSFFLDSDQAYGPYRPDNIIEVPMDVFRKGGVLQGDLLVEGQYITLTDDGGVAHNGKIHAWDDEQVRVDFNHAMAGKDLFFRGVVMNLRPARPEELRRNHFIAQNGIRRDP